jgi:hypothetical protein
LPRRSAVLGQESPHLHHVLQASSQQFQGSVHVLQRLGTLRCHISASGSAAGQPPVRIDPCRAMQEDHISRPYCMTVWTIDRIELVGLHDLLSHRALPSYTVDKPHAVW